MTSGGRSSVQTGGAFSVNSSRRGVGVIDVEATVGPFESTPVLFVSTVVPLEVSFESSSSPEAEEMQIMHVPTD